MTQVSIIIPCYNCEKLLVKCLDSVRAQTFAGWEAIVVDDGSADSSAEILAGYAARDSRIRVVMQENRGQAAARNRALGLASGEYVCFLDADDFYDAAFVADLLSEARRTGADIVMTNTRRIIGDETRWTNLDCKVLTDCSEEIAILPHGGVWDKMFRMDLIRKNNVAFPEGLFYEDSLFLVKALLHANKLAVVGGASYNYVANPDGSIQNPAKEQKRVKDGVSVAKMIMNLAEENHVDKGILTDFVLRNVLNIRKISEVDFVTMRDALSPTPYLKQQISRRKRRIFRQKVRAFFGWLFNRDRFSKDMEVMSSHEAPVENKKFDYICLNFWTSLNYGAILTAYALQCILDRFGFRNAHVDYRPVLADRFNGSFTDRFARKHLHMTQRCFGFRDFEGLNECTERGFIVGSDQVFRDDYIRAYPGLYLLGFAAADKQRIAVSASFGKDSFSIDKANLFFKAFDAISVREKSGLDILRNNGYEDGAHILDPVFLVDKQIFSDLAKDVDVPSDMIVGYVLDESEEIEAFVKTHGGKYTNIAHRDLDVEEFLAYLMRARAVITDSFHGTCFAIIFNKPFRCFYNEARGNARFASLFESLGLSANSLNNEPDWTVVNRLIEKEREKGLSWIASSLETRKPKDKRLCRKLKKIAAAKRRHRHTLWWHLMHLKF